ncbi:MAG: hypothetical protein N2Z74_09825, partial [Syntrophales bacterium]|nr:hypothetical protein [Syntrophales bacterium]
MPLFPGIRTWLESNRWSDSGAVYDEHGFLYDIVGRFVGDIPLDRDSCVYLTGLKDKGTVVYALKDRSQLNTLILHTLARRRG